MATATLRTRLTHFELSLAEDNEPSTVGAVTANACCDDILAAIELEPDLANSGLRADRTHRTQKSVLVPNAGGIRNLILRSGSISVGDRRKRGRFRSGAERNDSVIPLELTGKKDPFFWQATGISGYLRQ